MKDITQMNAEARTIVEGVPMQSTPLLRAGFCNLLFVFIRPSSFIRYFTVSRAVSP